MTDVVMDKDAELEDGECTDSDDDQIKVDSENSRLGQSSFATHKPASDAYYNYSSRIPQIVINSDESDSSDDDDCPSSWKKSRNPTSSFHRPERADSKNTFINPLLSQQTAHSNVAANSKGKKRNNVWGSVLTEQVLSQDIKSFGVDNPEIRMGSRDVESYDYTKAKEDDRPEIDIIDPDASKDELFAEIVDLEKEVKTQESRKRKRTIKERLGKRSFDKSRPYSLGVTEMNTESEVVQAITEALREPKIDLFTRIVQTIGKELSIRLYYMTEDVENAGGMMINNGFRRRTAGGVYIQLLKSEGNVSPTTIEAIFSEDEQAWLRNRKEERKIKRAARRRWKKQKEHLKKITVDMDRPETPTPAEDLEIVDVLDGSNDFDAADLPERPATPEPKDDSSDGEEEDEEDEDISVVIAKAKAAILEKQREMASAQNDDSEKLSSDNLMDNSSTEKMSACGSTNSLETDNAVDIGEMEDS